MRCGCSAEMMSSRLCSTQLSATTASLCGRKHTRWDAELHPTAKENGFQRCTHATTPPMATSSEERCTKKALVVPPALKDPVAPPRIQAFVIPGHHRPSCQQPQDDQQGRQQEGHQGEPPQLRSQRGKAQQQEAQLQQGQQEGQQQEGQQQEEQPVNR